MAGDSSTLGPASERAAAAGVPLREVEAPAGTSVARLAHAAAKGSERRLQVFLTAPAVPLPGWLPSMLALLGPERDAGVVGARIVSRFGFLEEAGGILADGKRERRGEGDANPDRPEYCFVRRVDFCSPPLLATKRELFDRLGGVEGGGVSPDDALVDFSAARRPVRGAGLLPAGGAGRSARERGSMKSRRALVISPRLPEFDRESGLLRVLHVIEMLQRRGWEVTFGCLRLPTDPERYARVLEQRGVEVHAPLRKLEQIRDVDGFELAIIAFWHVAERFLPELRELAPSTRVVVDSVDLHFVREAREQFRIEDASGPGQLDTDQAGEMVRELNAYAAADAVLTVSREGGGQDQRPHRAGRLRAHASRHRGACPLSRAA